MDDKNVRRDERPEWNSLSVMFFPGDMERIETFFRARRRPKKGVFYRDAIMNEIERQEAREAAEQLAR